MHFQTLLAWLACAFSVSAHGYVDNVTISGTTYIGYQPYSDPYMNPRPDRIIRPIPGNGPAQDVTLIDLQCGGDTLDGVSGSSPAKLTGGPTAAGSTVSLRWTLWPDSHVGPIITYMARCASDNCATFVPGKSAVWFKVAEAGRTGTSGVWGDSPLMKPGGKYTYTVPSCLAAGSYLVRHEIIALHSSSAYPGAQFYPSCHQLKVTGSGTSSGPATKVAFPGAYKGSDPGITYDVYKAQTYTIPGPALFKC